MLMRVGKVTNIYNSTGKVKVVYEDENNTSRPLSMLTMNDEYSMPTVGDRVVTVHMENGSSKGFVLGTYYGGGTQPKASGGYRKDFGSGAYAICNSGNYNLRSAKAIISGRKANVSLGSDASLTGQNVLIEAESGPVKAKTSSASIVIDEEIVIKASNVTVEADNITLKCSYGEITVEELMKRLERIEDNLGLPHTIE